MNGIQEWLKEHKFIAHTMIFLAMVISSLFMYFSASNGNLVVISILLILFVIANLISMLI